jgi:hypothetical protein
VGRYSEIYFTLNIEKFGFGDLYKP